MSDIKRTGRAHAATSLASAMATVGHDRGAIYTGAGLVVAIAASVAAVVAFTLVYWHALASEPLFSWAVVGCAVALVGGVWLQRRLAAGQVPESAMAKSVLGWAIATALVWLAMPTSAAFLAGGETKWPMLVIPLYVAVGWIWVYPLYPSSMLVVCGGAVSAVSVRFVMLGGIGALAAAAGLVLVAAIVVGLVLLNAKFLKKAARRGQPGSLFRPKYGGSAAGDGTAVATRKLSERELENRLEWFGRAETVADIGQWYWPIGSNEVQWSGAMYRLAGVDADSFEPTYHAVIELYHKADRERVQAIYRDAMDRRAPFEFETSIIRANGEEREILVQGRCETEGDTLVALFGFFQDITDRKTAEQALRRSEAFYRAIVEAQSELIFRCLFDGALTFVNEAFCRFFGVARNDAIGACLFEPDDPQAPIMPREAAEVLNVAFEKLTPEIPRATEEIEIVGSDGETRWLLCTHQALFDHRDFLIEYQTVALEITDRKLADSKIQYLAHHDALTGLPNRALFHDRMELAMAHAERNQGRAAILLLDLDNFKHVNDALGHATGDILLRDVAGRLKECVRAVDTVARLGGDEFVIIQAGIETGEQAVILAERIRAAITKPFAIEGHDIQTGTSIGITIYPDDSVDSAQVLKNADMALYRAKARERGTYEFYSRELGRTAQKRLDIAAGLRRALAVGEELSLVFQPKFSLDTGHAIGVEALLRWDRPGHEPISPAEFIPVAEATGLKLGRTAQKRLDIAAGLRRALAVGEELSLVFQPKFSLDTGHAIGVEALLRWDRPGHEPISPAEFIPVAEATGLILPIGEWVLRRACEHLKGWRDAGVPMVPLSVNLSAAQFRDQTLVDKIKCCLDDFTIDPAMLEIEITETALMHDAETATNTLCELVGVGISVSIDDFGTGYSSLNYLKQFPVGKLKIDRSFVADIGISNEDSAIARAVIQLGHSLGLSVLAEGVETNAQLEVLRDLGCDEVQGFLMSRPVTADEYARSMSNIWADMSGEDLATVDA